MKIVAVLFVLIGFSGSAQAAGKSILAAYPPTGIQASISLFDDGTLSFGGGLTIVGNRDINQLLILANSSQTANIFSIRDSAINQEWFTVRNLGPGGLTTVSGQMTITGTNDANELEVDSFGGQANPIASFNAVDGGSTVINSDGSFQFDDGNGHPASFNSVGLTLSDGIPFLHNPPSYLIGNSGNLSSLVSAPVIGVGKTISGHTVQNIEAVADAFTCTVNPVITLQDCSTSSACGSPTTIGTATVTAANTIADGSISVADLAAAHYWRFKITAGTCAALTVNVTAFANVK